MLKKLTSLFFSLLLALSLLPGQALAAEEPAPAEPPVIAERWDPDTPEEPVMPASAEQWPDEADKEHSED